MIGIKIEGLEKLQANLGKFPKEIEKNLAQAGTESAELEIFPVSGLKTYPASTSQRYIRGRGTQTLSRNYGDSERYGTQFYTRNDGSKTFLGNRASYAVYLTDADKQSSVMAGKGWRKLVEVVNEKLDRIKSVYENWVQRTIKDLGL